MKPVDFEGSNATYAKEQAEYLPLPVLHIAGAEGHVISCWRCETLWERLRIMWTGCVWVSQLSFNQPLQPQRLDTSLKDAIG